jgi:hypothetical protein
MLVCAMTDEAANRTMNRQGDGPSPRPSLPESSASAMSAIVLCHIDQRAGPGFLAGSARLSLRTGKSGAALARVDSVGARRGSGGALTLVHQDHDRG